MYIYIIVIYITPGKKVSILATGCRRQGPKNDTKFSKLAYNQRKSNDAKICSEILVAVVFRIFSRYGIYILNALFGG